MLTRAPRRHPTASIRIVLLAAALLLAASPASAEPRQFERIDGAFVWGIAGLEVSFTAAMILRMTVWDGPMQGPGEGLLLTAPFVVAAATGVGGYLWCLPPRLALGLHGGLYTGLAAGLGAGLVRGALSEAGTLRFDSLAGVAALVGTVPGLLLGSLEVDPDDPLAFWLGGPPGGMLVGVVGAAILAVSLFLSGNDPGPGTGDQVVGWPIFAGLAGGLVLATGSVVGDP